MGTERCPSLSQASSSGGFYWDFPYPRPGQGSLKTQSSEGVNAGDNNTILEVEGKGIVREIFIACGATPPENFYEQSHFKIYYSTDPGATATIDVPAGALLGVAKTWVASGNDGRKFETPLGVVESFDNDDHGIRIRIPIPFDDGIKITFQTADGFGTYLYSTVIYQDYLPSVWNNKYKLRVSRVSGTVLGDPFSTDGTGTISTLGKVVTGNGTILSDEIISTGFYLIPAVANASGIEVDSSLPITAEACTLVKAPAVDWADTAFKYGVTHKFLDEPAGTKGFIVAVGLAWHPDAAVDYSFLENNPHFHVNREANPSYEWSGTEDYFGGAFFFAGGDQNFTSARWLEKDDTTNNICLLRVHAYDPIPFTGGILGHWPMAFNAGEAKSGVTGYSVCIYYVED